MKSSKNSLGTNRKLIIFRAKEEDHWEDWKGGMKSSVGTGQSYLIRER